MSLQQVLLHFGNLPKNLNGDSENTMKTEKQTYDKDALNDLRDLFGGIQSKYLFILGKWLIRCHQNIVITGKKGCGKKKLLNAIYLEALSEIKAYPNSNVRLCIVDSVDDIKGTSILLGCIRPDKNEMFIFTHSATTPKAFLKLLNWKIGLAYGKIFPRNYTDVILQLVKFEIHIDIVGNSRLISRVNEYILNDDGVIESIELAHFNTETSTYDILSIPSDEVLSSMALTLSESDAQDMYSDFLQFCNK